MTLFCFSWFSEKGERTPKPVVFQRCIEYAAEIAQHSRRLAECMGKSELNSPKPISLSNPSLDVIPLYGKVVQARGLENGVGQCPS